MTTSTSQNSAAPTLASPRFGKLKRVLEDLFQFNQAELDFGIYRIMNAKREEIRRFLDVDLLPQVQLELGKLAGGNRAEIELKLKQETENTLRYGGDPEKSQPVQELRRQLAAADDVGALEADIYNDLAGFFKRYYQNGDFLSLRRYKKDVYAIPYEGEEVKLHWANADQYYVKSSEAFRDYTFHLPTTDGEGGCRVHFRITDADTEANNNKAENGKERRFILADPPLEETNGELSVRFTYRVSGEKQAKLNAEAADTILAQAGFDGWLSALKEPRPTEKNPKRTLLDKQLGDYTSKNSFDYFIHKDLRGFLRRELDFFIKNEVLQLDDLEAEGEARALQQLARVKAMRGVAHKIIEMLSQLENFQKKLWLKKKFVVSTDYCVTLDKIIENAPGLLGEVAGNEAQRSKWVRLFALDELKGYSEPLTTAFLEANPFLVLDTQFFDSAFKDKLLANFDDLDAQTDGLLIKSENFQALNLLQARYREQINSIFVDPPYNAVASEIAYKNEFKHSSWLSLITDRVAASKPLMNEQGIFCITIDDYEYHRLQFCLTQLFGEDNYLATALIRSNPSGRSTVKGFAINHEYSLFYAATEHLSEIGRLQHSEQQKERYGEIEVVDGVEKRFEWENFRKSSAESNRSDRPKQHYPIYYDVNSGKLRIPEMTWHEAQNCWEILEESDEGESIIYPLNSSRSEKVWQWGYERARTSFDKLKVVEVKGALEVYKKKYWNEGGVLPRTWWDKPSYSARDSGTAFITNLFRDKQAFDFPKSVNLVMDSLRVARATPATTTLDYFAGSGTTGHAVINLNREDGGSRKYILVEMGEYFDSVLKPRIQKVVYSKDWKDGKPVSREGSSQLVKVLRLESYEDALNNIEVRQPTTGQSALDFSSDAMKGFREDYLLHYMLDVETRGSASLLNFESFQNPFAYELKIATSSAGETRPTKVDLVETFNYLLGLRVKTVETLQGFRVVTGANPAGEQVLIIWRNLQEKDNAALDAFFDKQKYNPRDMEFDLIYVNGDNNLQNLRREDESWKVRLIEEEFQRLMFDVRDV